MNVLAGILIGLVFIVESCVWYIRSMSLPQYRSKSISTSNIVMYVTRVFVVGYQIILNFSIESGGGLKQVLMATFIGMVVSLIGHSLLFYNHKSLSFSWRAFLSIFKKLRLIQLFEYEKEIYVPVFICSTHRVVIASALSTIALVFVYITPQIFATLYSGYRLTLSSIGQAISFFGMLITLFLLDPAMFKMHDEGEIQRGFSLYLLGRVAGLALALLLLLPWILF